MSDEINNDEKSSNMDVNDTPNFDGWSDSNENQNQVIDSESPKMAITIDDFLKTINGGASTQRYSEFYLQAGLSEIYQLKSSLNSMVDDLQSNINLKLDGVTQFTYNELQNNFLKLGILHQTIAKAFDAQESLFLATDRKLAEMAERNRQQLEHVVCTELRNTITQSLDDAHRRAAMIPVKIDKSVWLTIIGLSVLIGSLVGAGMAFLFFNFFT